MATLSELSHSLDTTIVYDERTKRFHDLAMNYKMVTKEKALKELTSSGRPSRIGAPTEYVTQASFDALRRDVYAMMSSIAENASIALNELKRALASQEKDTQLLLNYENRENEDRLEGRRNGLMERIGDGARTAGRIGRQTLRAAPSILGGLGLAGLATVLAATRLTEETIEQLEEYQRQLQELGPNLLLAAEIVGGVLGGLFLFRRLNRATNRISRTIRQAFSRPPPGPTSATAPNAQRGTGGGSAARGGAAAGAGAAPRIEPRIPIPPTTTPRPLTPGQPLTPRPGVEPRVSPPGRPPERVPAPAVEGGRAPASRPSAPASGRPVRIPGAGIARLAGNVMLGLAPSIAYYMTTTSEQREVADIEELGENARNYALQFERATTELNRLQGLPETDPGRSTLVIQANQQQINLSRREVDNQIRRLEHAREVSRTRIRNYERSISTERNNPYGANQNTINEAQNQLDRHQRRIELAEAYLTETRGLRLMMNNSELVREMPTSAAGRLTEEQRQHAAIALGQGTLTPERLASMVAGREAIVLPPIVQRVQRQTPSTQPATQQQPSQQQRPSGGNPLTTP